jgi:hypothetical protein
MNIPSLRRSYYFHTIVVHIVADTAPWFINLGGREGHLLDSKVTNTPLFQTSATDYDPQDVTSLGSYKTSPSPSAYFDFDVNTCTYCCVG